MDSDTDSDSGLPESTGFAYDQAPLADYSVPLPGTPATPAKQPLLTRARLWIKKKVKKGRLLSAYLGKELRDHASNAR